MAPKIFIFRHTDVKILREDNAFYLYLHAIFLFFKVVYYIKKYIYCILAT